MTNEQLTATDIIIELLEEVKETNKRANFNNAQLIEIFHGVLSGVNAMIYAKGCYSAEQMEIIRCTLENNLEVDWLLNPKLAVSKMKQMFSDLANGTKRAKKLQVKLKFSDTNNLAK